MRKTFVKKARMDGQISLQITSMADIFMIILVFLLKSYGSGAIDVTPSPGVAMASALSGSGQAEGLKIEVSENAIRMNGEAVAPVTHFNFLKTDLSSAGASRKLVSALQLHQKTATPSTQLIVLADRRAPYETIKAVLASAALTGYKDFKLAVVNAN